ncbi:PhoI [Thermococcus aciditolerans]|uniref:PhoI n=1 Tax=Thermococcus aciditolerans TaxID=2598455 RepID=A0A5C0SLX7_9EURY|nr:PhoI [Thermococcus aciditolerans]QEK15413.1 PhoI [Thermococcus aciditolerans]
MEFEMKRMQAFFPASLEIQEELLKAGFKVPYDKENGRKTPVPVVVSSGMERKLRRNRLLKARDFESDGKFALVPGERALLELELTERGFLVLRPKPIEYHLEEMGFVSVPPRVWGTWASFSLPFSAYDELVDFLGDFRNDNGNGFYTASRGSGGRIEVYAYKGRKGKDLGIPVFGYALGLHGLTLAEEYFREKAKENGVPEERLRYLRLGLRKRRETKAGLKVGLVWENGRPVEITLKLSTTEPRVRIQGLYGELVGKSRGELARTDEWYIVVHAGDFITALEAVGRAFGDKSY